MFVTCLALEQEQKVAFGRVRDPTEDRPESQGGPDRERALSEREGVNDERPVPADFDGVAVTGALHCFGQGVELALLSCSQEHEGALLRFRGQRRRWRLRPHAYDV